MAGAGNRRPLLFHRKQTGWAGGDDGMLVWDRNGDGRINDGRELFGNETLLARGAKADNGFQALAELDPTPMARSTPTTFTLQI